jgi:hypothetical protein
MMISDMVNLEKLRHFVRETLGCDCPEEVFEDVVIGVPRVFLELEGPSIFQTMIGRRLLVSVVPLNALSDIRTEACLLLQNGRRVRDAHQLGRFRLVLVGDLDRETVKWLTAEADRIDPKVHVHCLKSL